MIKKLLLGTVVLAMSAATAYAADLPSRRAPPVYVPPPLPVFSWTGAYIGVNAGYAFDNHTNYRLTGNNAVSSARIANGGVPGYSSANDNGFTGGMQIGYNYELGSGLGIPVLGNFGGLGGGGLVAGVEADAAYTDLNNNNNSFGGLGGAANFRSRTEYVGTARGRLGIAFANALLYGTGGFAYGGVRNGFTIGAASTGTDRIRTGYAYGGGVEYAIPTSSFVNVFNAGAVTLKVEYIHYDLGTDTLSLNNGGNAAYTARVRNDGNLVRAGLNYKFNFLAAGAPVVARY